MLNIAVLGAGLVGRTIARDLSRDFSVTAFDRDPETLTSAFLESEVTIRVEDLSDPASVRKAIEAADIVVDALPGFLGRQTLETVLDAGKDTVDIAFAPGDLSDLGQLASRRGVAAIVDMGVAPGMSNAILGHHVSTMAAVERFECLVGGLPVERRWPFEYRAPFSPSDVLEEYTRPARFRESGQNLEIPALSNREWVDFPGIGTLESFDTDGLRSLLASYPEIPSMREKTLRYPGHAALMEILRETGFLSADPIALGDSRVRPIDLTSRLLFPHWKLDAEHEEFTVMRVRVEGRDPDGKPVSHQWDLHDRTDRVRQDSSMARTTGFACNAAVNLIIQGKVEPGLWFPEKIGEDPACFRALLDYQRARGVNYLRN